EGALAQHLAEFLPGIGTGIGPDQRIEHAVLGGELGLGRDLLAQPLAGHRDRHFDEVAGDLLDVAPDIADLGEFRRLDFQERCLGEPREPTGDLGLATAGRPDHQDVLRQYLFAQLRRKLLAPPAVAQGDGDGALGVVLADDEAVKLGDDLARAERDHRRPPLSWPGSTRPSPKSKTWMPGAGPGMTVKEAAAGHIVKLSAFPG